ncbi:MAG: stage II sporulation protein D [Bacilli bacterium]|nr:stage II sporulation protein D [Bacilli bacterium]
MNKKLIYTLVILIPITIISFFFKETNFIMQQNKQSVDKYQVNIDTTDKILTVELEEYIIGVVAGEMPALFSEEALKAQAIASRTYLINHLQTNKTITNTTDDQVYLTKEEMKEKWKDDYDKYYNKIKEAVTATKGLIMYYNNEPIKAYYFSTSNGYTASSISVFNEQRDYLTSVESPFDQDNSNTIEISKQDFCNKLDISCNEISITNIIKDNSNRISKITINNKEFKGTQVRKLLSLRSTDFTFNIKETTIEIITKGYGHGVGMSQYGANNMAKIGYTYEEILKYYYQDIKIDSI